jgi:hypothetical protein
MVYFNEIFVDASFIINDTVIDLARFHKWDKERQGNGYNCFCHSMSEVYYRTILPNALNVFLTAPCDRWF